MANKVSEAIAENNTKVSDKDEGNEHYTTILMTWTVLQRVPFPADINKDYIPVCQCQPPCLTWGRGQEEQQEQQAETSVQYYKLPVICVVSFGLV